MKIDSKIKGEVIKLRVDADTAARMHAVAGQQFNGNMSACIRCSVLSFSPDTSSPQVRELKGDLKFLGSQIRMVGNNLNQLVKHANSLPRDRFYPHDVAMTVDSFLRLKDELQALISNTSTLIKTKLK